MGICDRSKKLEKMQNRIKSEQSNDEVVQKQSAGENSNQVQVGTVVVNQGITEERARDVFAEMIPQALDQYTHEAYETANKRINRFENIIIPRMLEIEGTLASFSDPVFQAILRKAQQSAATTERNDDYALLSELIVCQVQKGSERKNRTGISKAVEIVGDIDSEALCALTLAHAVNVYIPTSGNMKDGLQVLNGLFEKLFYSDPPTDNDWLDHLDILVAIRISKFVSLKKLRDYYSEILNGYVCVGIKSDSDEYKKAIEILTAERLDVSIMTPNDLLGGYAKLPVVNKEAIRNMIIVNNSEIRKISDNEIEALEKIWDLYSQDGAMQQEVKNEFNRIWDSYDSLKKLRIWWESLPYSFDITKVGTVLAHTNAKRCDSGLPDLL